MDIEFFQKLELEYKLLVNLVTVMRFELINCMGKLSLLFWYGQAIA